MNSNTLILGASFGILLVLSLYYSWRIRFWEGIIGLLAIAYFQGLILALIFFNETIILLFSSAIIFAILYYSIFPKLYYFVIFYKIFKFSKTNDVKDKSLNQSLIQLWDIPSDKLFLKTFGGSKSLNAFIQQSKKYYKILIGEQLIDLVNREEMLFILSHEIAHNRINSRLKWGSRLFLFIYVFFCASIPFLLVITNLINFYSIILTSSILYLIGIVIVNYSSWRVEYEADRLAVLRIKDTYYSIQALEKLHTESKDERHHFLVDLIISDHPPIVDRINRLKTLQG